MIIGVATKGGVSLHARPRSLLPEWPRQRPSPRYPLIRPDMEVPGRRPPHRFSWSLAFQAVPGLAEFFDRDVPPSFWVRDADEQGFEVAVIACPCGDEPQAGLGKAVECSCGRFYLWAGKVVKVGRPGDVEAALPT